MTESKVKAIRAGIALPEEKLEPGESLVNLCEKLLEDAKKGELRQLCFASSYSDNTLSRNIAGEVKMVAQMDCMLKCLSTDYYELFAYPSYSGGYEDLEE